jgi:excisionase family DNA binding protein
MQFLTADEAAAICRVPKSTLYEARKKKELGAVILGRHFRVTREELMRWAGVDPTLTPTNETAGNGSEQAERTKRRKR